MFTVDRMRSFRISELAERSGVPATTLRFYEQQGLLPADRTAAGYRVYGEGAVERLEFISSAKLLGLSLEDIRDLLEVRDGGQCSSVRARILPLVEDRMRQAEGRVAELRAFSGRLAAVRAILLAPTPEGACGPDCGCTTTRAVAGPAPVARERAPGREVPVACTLAATELDDRVVRWRELVSWAEREEQIPGGVRLLFPVGAELAGEIAALAVAEQDCCAFFDFTLRMTPVSLQLDIRAPEP